MNPDNQFPGRVTHPGILFYKNGGPFRFEGRGKIIDIILVIGQLSSDCRIRDLKGQESQTLEKTL